jgi:hypothetical protein
MGDRERLGFVERGENSVPERGVMKGEHEEQPIGEDELDDWEIVAAQPSKSRSIVLSVRFDPEELRAIRDAAARAGVAMGDVIREAVHKYLPSASSFATSGYSQFATANVLGGSAVVTFGGGRDLDQEEILTGTGG